MHELLHFKERQHNDRFKALLDTYMPDWRSRRDLLNQMLTPAIKSVQSKLGFVSALFGLDYIFPG